MTLAAFRRRDLLGLLAGAAAAPLLPEAADAATPPTLLVFGDSYSVEGRMGTRGWSQQLRQSGSAGATLSLAKSGATAGGTTTSGRGSFTGQVNTWRNQHGGRLMDRTVVYLGYNDLNRSAASFSAARSRYAAQVDRLIAAGLTSGNRRLILIELHDWSRYPGSVSRSRVTSWNRWVRAVAATRPGCVTVDLLGLFDRVYARPGSYGFTNVTRPNRALSATTYLYLDTNHFGSHGLRLIADAIRPRLAGSRLVAGLETAVG